jgi:hypothetical protein
MPLQGPLVVEVEDLWHRSAFGFGKRTDSAAKKGQATYKMIATCILLSLSPSVISAPVNTMIGNSSILNSLHWGVNVHWDGSSPSKPGEFEQASQVASIIRTDMRWGLVERVAGVYNWSVMEPRITEWVQGGVVPYLILDGANSVYNGTVQNSASVRTAFVNYAVAAMAHFPGRILWELYNGKSVSQATPTLSPAI